MDRIEILYDHYKETSELCRESQKRRNTLFVVLCLLESLSFLFVINPVSTTENIITVINTYLEADFTFEYGILQTLLWVLVAYVTIRYCQETLSVERLYNYLNALETSLTKECSISFKREGEEYFSRYPIVLNIIDLFYKMFCPILFVTINIIRINLEWKGKYLSLSLMIDTVVFLSIFIVSWFYFFEIHSKITNWFKQRFAIINKIALLLRKLLKEV